MWISITEEKYLATYTADYKIISSSLAKGGRDDKFLEVILGIENKPLLKHTINPAFEVECWKWEED